MITSSLGSYFSGLVWMVKAVLANASCNRGNVLHTFPDCGKLETLWIELAILAEEPKKGKGHLERNSPYQSSHTEGEGCDTSSESEAYAPIPKPADVPTSDEPVTWFE
jgi:hypothetical protein